MSLNKYIRSKTVRDYYDEIGYEISPMVALWTIINAPYQFVEDQHKDLKELIDTTEDICIDELCWNLEVNPTFHSLINYFFELYNSYLDEFIHQAVNEKYVVSSADYSGDSDGFYGIVSSSFEECSETIKQFRSEYVYGAKNARNNLAALDGCSMENFCIQKHILSDERLKLVDGISLIVNKDMKIIAMNEGENTKIHEFKQLLDDMDFEIPLPFEHGDIVKEERDNGYLNNLVYDDTQCGDDGYKDPFVVCYLVSEEDRLYTYMSANPFLLEKSDVKNDELLPLTRALSSFEKRQIKTPEFLNYYLELQNEIRKTTVLEGLKTFELWEVIKREVWKNTHICNSSFPMWLDGLKIVDINDHDVYIKTRTESECSIFSKNRMHFEEAIYKQTGYNAKVHFI